MGGKRSRALQREWREVKRECKIFHCLHGEAEHRQSKVPMPPPNGMQPQFIVTIQPTGAMFDPPAKLTLPNVDGYAPDWNESLLSPLTKG
jgi:hypothetical protein